MTKEEALQINEERKMLLRAVLYELRSVGIPCIDTPGRIHMHCVISNNWWEKETRMVINVLEFEYHNGSPYVVPCQRIAPISVGKPIKISLCDPQSLDIITKLCIECEYVKGKCEMCKIMNGEIP